MALKTDYRDDLYDGQRRYNQIKNADGTVSMVDATTYTQAGDKFGAKDMNATNTEVNKIQRTVVVSLPLSGWGNAAPYSQRVEVSGIKGTDMPEVKVYAPKTLGSAAAKLRVKLTAMITAGETEDGYATFYCGAKKPTADFQVLLKGVSGNG